MPDSHIGRFEVRTFKNRLAQTQKSIHQQRRQRQLIPTVVKTVLRSEVLDSREVLITGATVGVTSLTIWFESGEPLEQLVTAHVTALRGTPCCDGD